MKGHKMRGVTKRGSIRAMAVVALSLLAGMQTARAQDVNLAARPQAPAERASTNFSGALACMDGLLARSQYRRGVRILVHRLDEPPQEIGANTRDLIVRALSRMTQSSRFFQVETDPSEETLRALPANAIVVEGSVTAFERDLKGRNKSGGISLGPLGFGFGSNNTESRMEVTLYLKGGGAQPAVLPGTTSQVAIALASRSRNGDVAGNIRFLGGFIGAGFSRSDGPMAALAALIDLAMIQSVGSYAQLPYERCLAGAADDPAQLVALRRTYDRMRPAERVRVVAEALAARGRFAGSAPTAMTPALREAIAIFQRDQGLIASGEPSFELYQALQDAPDRLPQAGQLPASITENPLGLVVTPASPSLKALRTAEAWQLNAENAVLINDRVSVAVSSTRPAHVACFHVDAAARVAMVYPNARRSGVPLRPGQPLTIPGSGDLFVIQADQPDRMEHMICLGAAAPLEPLMPAPLRRRLDVGAQPLSITELDQLITAVRATAPDFSRASMGWRALCPSPQSESGLGWCDPAAAPRR
jgi:peptidoglycan hydrolase-like protein with peptidoglycan-binding domain